jgi:hypothetical protein
MASGAPINKPMGVGHTILPPDGNHAYSRIRGVNPCVGYKTVDTFKDGTAKIHPHASPAAVQAGCAANTEDVSNIQFFRTADSYAVGRQNVDFGVRDPGAYTLNLSASKNFSIPEASRIHLGDEMKLQIRVDFLNAFNHPNWDKDYNTDPTDSNFGTIRQGPDGPNSQPRYLQLSGRLTW